MNAFDIIVPLAFTFLLVIAYDLGRKDGKKRREPAASNPASGKQKDVG